MESRGVLHQPLAQALEAAPKISTCPRESFGDQPTQTNPLSWHLFLGPQLLEEALDLSLPALLHGVEGIPGHFPLDLRLDGLQLLQDGGEVGSAMGILGPAVWGHGMEEGEKIKRVVSGCHLRPKSSSATPTLLPISPLPAMSCAKGSGQVEGMGSVSLFTATP